MSLSSWFFPTSKSSEPALTEEDAPCDQVAARPSTDDSLDFETIAEKVETLQCELAYSQDLCEQANLQFQKYRVDISDLKLNLATERASNAILKELLTHERNNSHVLKSQLNGEKQELKRQRVLMSQMQARMNSDAASLEAMTRHAQALEKRYAELQFDLEYLQCVADAERLQRSPTVQSTESPVPAQPFVVVLIDGDAYRWSSDIFQQDNHIIGGAPVEPGGLAATRIKNEVTKYIMEQNSNIPVTAKIIVRVFCNFGSTESRMIRRQKTRNTAVGLRDFAVQFTERLPLFDFFDSGRGKERADDKIRENFHLFLSTPNCHAVFVAACTDNGFVRMLEQYADHPFAWQKIVLVSPGYVASEFQRFNFKSVTWPSIFDSARMPHEMAMKLDQALRRKKVQKLLAYRAFSVGAPQAEPDLDYRDLLLTVLPRWNVNSGMGKVSQGLGLSMKPASALEWKIHEEPVNVLLNDDVD
ncbi:hypothetical protein PV08_09409 [Exophiala spinifera]|uniref:DUF7923 domain-containing protein n=1 Tax=Exophiala spinifera TaxID=91928 RepID=A0A0D2BLT2_9EURO|nr:uncharacterized protein PV08_09409 [Exophiala spinifera]KIW12134.1 hypothetical protein PV08_09409 [Exophiala spinifera]